MRFSQDFIERVQDVSNIVDIISQYTQLKPTGGGLMGRCPFPDHKEKTASFSVSETKQVYHCFGCHKSGNIFTFLKDYQGMNFPEAVEYLAQRANIPLPKDERAVSSSVEDKGKERRKEILRANKLTLQFYQEQLKRVLTDHPVKKYIEKRGLSRETLETFQIGYAPKEWDGLTQFLNAKSIPTSISEEARLIVARKEGRSGHFDLFRDRLIFPILNSMGDVLAFGGRIIEQGEPKYLNSPETPVFTKGRVLYGLQQTARFIRSEDQAILVEGYMDLVALYQAGIQNVAATLGTALTSDHARVIKRLTRNVLVLFDGDQAGRDAAERSLPLLLQADLYPKGLILPQGMDPDDYVKNYGAQALRTLMGEAQDLFFLILETWMTEFKGEPAEKVKLVDKAQGVLGLIPDRRLRDLYIGEMASRLRVSTKWLEQALALNKKDLSKTIQSANRPLGSSAAGGIVSANLNPQAESSDETKISLKKAMSAEVMVMSLALKSRANFEIYQSENIYDCFSSEGVQRILRRAQDVYRQEPEKFDRLTSLLVSFVDEPKKLFPSESLILSQESGVDSETGVDSRDLEAKLLRDAMRRVRESFLKEKLKRLSEDLRTHPSPEKLEQLMNIQKDISALNKGI